MKIKVGVNLDGFIEWDGGIDFISYVIQGINLNTFEIILLIPNKNNKINILKNNVKFILNKFFNRKYNVFDNEYYQRKLNNLVKQFDFLYFNDINHLDKICIENSLKIIFPCFKSLGKNFKTPWIGYIYDFQHKYLADLFCEKDIVSRNFDFALMNEEAKGIVVNSNQTKDDILFFLGEKAKIYVLPFTPKKIDLEKYKIETESQIRSKYNLETSPYFIVSNQFWTHKRHDVVIRAFIYYKEKYKTNAKLIITGKLSGLNNQDYIFEISKLIDNSSHKKDIILTDYISKDDQLSLLKYSNLVIQPTNFEGGPGGGIVYEAIFFNKKCIVSDIKVNKEINHPLVYFFKVNDVSNLAESIFDIDEKNIKVDMLSDNSLLENTIEKMIKTETGC